TNNSNFNKRVNTVNDKNVNAARPNAVVNTAWPKAVISAVKGNKGNDVKASTCWVWRPKHKVLDHVSRKNGVSMSFKRFDYVDAQGGSSKSQFWTIAKVKTVNGEVQIQSLVDKKRVIITETSIRMLRLLLGMNLVALWPQLSSVLPQTKNSTFLMFLDKQVEGMSKHKKIYVTPSHTKKVFANMKRQGKDFSGRNTPLFPTMIVQAQEQEGEEPIADEAPNDENVTTHSNDPLLSGEDRLKLNELIELCTNLSQRVLDLENTKTSQTAEITKLKERVKKLERRNKSRTPRLKRLRKVGRTARIVSFEDEDEEVTLIDETQGSNDDNLIATTTTVNVLTLAQTLIEIKAAKPKAVTTATTTTTTAVTRPKARGVVVQEPSEFTTTTSPSQPSQLPQAKDKGKEKMVKPEKPLKKKDQILIDEEIAQRLQEEMKDELEEEERMARQKEENANNAEWDNVLAMIDADYELAVRLQAHEQEELTIEERRYMDTELVKESSKKAEMVQESSSKRAGEELESDNSNKQKLDENVEAEVDDKEEMKKHMEIVPDGEVAIDVIPLATKSPIIIDWKIIKEGKMGYF
ncbi:hypothetical protein Tco_0659837, partial [Tanacetum coccineum]